MRKCWRPPRCSTASAMSWRRTATCMPSPTSPASVCWGTRWNWRVGAACGSGSRRPRSFLDQAEAARPGRLHHRRIEAELEQLRRWRRPARRPAGLAPSLADRSADLRRLAGGMQGGAGRGDPGDDRGGGLSPRAHRRHGDGGRARCRGGLKRRARWRKSMGVEPTRGSLAASPGFEVRTSHRERCSSKDCGHAGTDPNRSR